MSVVNVVLPGIIWPEIADLDYILHDAVLPGLSRTLSRASFSSYDIAYSDIVYSHEFVDSEPDLSLAQMYARKFLLSRQQGYLLVEPCNLRADRNRLLVSDSDIIQMNEQEGRELIASLNQHFAPDNITFHLIHEHLWLVALPYSVAGLNTHPLIDIVGKNISDYLPSGHNHLLLHRLFNEVQMLLHTNRVNKERGEDGLVTVNSLWFWNKQFKQLPAELSDIIDVNILKQLGDMVDSQYLGYEQLTARGSAVMVTNAYFSCCYRDSFSWVANMNKLDELIIRPLLSALKCRKIKHLKLWLITENDTKLASLRWYDVYKFWRINDYKSIISSWK